MKDTIQKRAAYIYICPCSPALIKTVCLLCLKQVASQDSQVNSEQIYFHSSGLFLTKPWESGILARNLRILCLHQGNLWKELHIPLFSTLLFSTPGQGSVFPSCPIFPSEQIHPHSSRPFTNRPWEPGSLSKNLCILCFQHPIKPMF